MGFASVPYGFILKLIPVKFFGCFSLNEDPITEDDASKSVVASFKHSHSMRKKKAPKSSAINDEFNEGGDIYTRMI